MGSPARDPPPRNTDMPTLDPRIDSYLDAAGGFAQPPLRDWRALVHQTCPDCEETIKWGMPHFLYRGKILTSMAAFKAHFSIGFWQGAAAVGATPASEGYGELGKLRSASDLPPLAQRRAMIERAMALIDGDATPARQRRAASPKPLPDVPAELNQALSKAPDAQAFFAQLAPSHQREYLEWILEAKRPETRERRIAQTVAWLLDGKTRNWKYSGC